MEVLRWLSNFLARVMGSYSENLQLGGLILSDASTAGAFLSGASSIQKKNFTVRFSTTKVERTVIRSAVTGYEIVSFVFNETKTFYDCRATFASHYHAEAVHLTPSSSLKDQCRAKIE